jgi:hypothetical protein
MQKHYTEVCTRKRFVPREKNNAKQFFSLEERIMRLGKCFEPLNKMKGDEGTEKRGKKWVGQADREIGIDQFYYDRDGRNYNCINVQFWGIFRRLFMHLL